MEPAVSNLQSVLGSFYEWEQKRPDAIFLRQPFGTGWEEYSWREVGRQARILVAAMREMGMRPGDHIGLISKNCAQWIIADLAIMMGGFVSVPFYPTLNAEQLSEVITLGHIKLLFAGKLDQWETMRTRVPKGLPIIAFPHYEGNSSITDGTAWEDLFKNHAPIEDSPIPQLDDLWTILFTSGTTGTPKGVMIDYRALANLLETEREYATLGLFKYENHRYFSYLPLNHIAERMIVEGAALATGGTISFSESLQTFAENLKSVQPTVFLAVPRIWTKFQQAIQARMPDTRLSRMLKIPLIGSLLKKKIRKNLGLHEAQITATGAAPAPDALKEWFLKFDIRIQEVYGMTENCGATSLMPADHLKPGTVGKPLPDVEVRIDKDTGEIQVRCPWMMRGYYNERTKTAEVLRNGWLHTGDQGMLDEEGFLVLTGRVVDTFKSAKGKYIVPGPIEAGFAKNSYIEQICVVGLALPQPMALVTLSELGQRSPRQEVLKSLESIRQEVNSILPSYEHLSAVIIVKEPWSIENGILTPTLKIKRNVLSKRYEPQLEKWSDNTETVIWEG